MCLVSESALTGARQNNPAKEILLIVRNMSERTNHKVGLVGKHHIRRISVVGAIRLVDDEFLLLLFRMCQMLSIQRSGR
jgi:hypothetical protein